MTSFAWLRARPRTMASVGAVAAAAVTLGTLALVYDGKPTTELDLHDGGVWVTKQSSLLVGHLNHQSQVLDGGLRATSGAYDILQDGSQVLVVDEQDSSATSVDPARVILADSADLPPGAQVAMGGGNVAIVDGSGLLWAVPFSSMGSFSPEVVEPIGELGAGAQATVGNDGAVYAVSPEQGALFTYGRADDDTIQQQAEHELDGLAKGDEVTITAVGATAYVLDAESNLMQGSDGSRVEVPSGAVLQEPSAAADAVTLSTPEALVRVTGDGEVASVPVEGEGTPAQPVFVAGCAYGAWSGSAQFVRDCPGAASDVVQAVEGVEPTSVLQFRVNRDVVVLNDVIGGAAWMASDSMQRVDNWLDLTPPEGEGDEEEETTEETVQTTLPERTERNTPPLAEDDRFGVRPGRTTVLPILANDTDADGDVLVATVKTDPSFGTVQPIHNGAALQIAVAEDDTGSTSFTYTVEDGRGGEATARVTVTVHGWETNSAPVQQRRTPITVETGGTASYNVLPDWIDPDGDDIFLQSVVPDGGDEADFTSDGQITYRAIGGMQGRKDVPIVVSDGTDEGAGIARYDIRPLGSTVPITNSDHVVTRVGQTATVSPLTNDTSSGREQLRLTRVDEVEGARITPDFSDGTFTFTSDVVGTYYAQYLVSAGANSVPGLVRVDVLPEGESDLPPIAVRDVALLPAGDEVLVNVLSNDTDPSGGLLVVQSVTVEDGSGVAAAVLGHETVRISDQGTLSQQIRVTYTISNGVEEARGEIIVIPVAAPDRLRPPVANDDEAVVRVGDVVTIPVLDNDYHPNGDTITVAPDLVPPLIDDEDGEMLVSENTLRFRASDEPGTVYATYEVEDSTGQRDAGYVTVQVLPRNDEANAAPRPRDVTARTLAGSKVTVPIELNGIDEDGDSVELIGIASAPAKGRITETGAASFTYEAFGESVGVDTFTYRVRDRLGKEGTARIQVGIAPAATANQAPYAVRDSVVMRPGREVALPVLVNDSDPDGDLFGFAANAVSVPDVEGLDATVSGEYLVITSPETEMNTSVQYTIEDERGLGATTSVQITVDEDVPLLRPIARDDRVRAEDVTEEGTADINVLDNDDDPDGTKSALDVALGTGGENASTRRDGVVRVTLTDERQLISYTVTDVDGQNATAFIHVPSLASLPPSLIAGAAVEVKSGETIELPLSEYVQAAGGRDVVITEAAKVSASHANGASLVQDQHTLVYTSADRYHGQDAITFEVTDGTGPDDPKGRKATLTIPITVTPPDNVPPTILGAQLNVAPGEDASTLDLAALATDPDPDDTLTFDLAGEVPDGLTAGVDGTVLSVSAATNTPKGTRVALRVTVSDGEAEPAFADIDVTVTASTRELASANDDVIEEADQGATISVPVLENDVNPFPDTPLQVVNAIVETGDADARISGDNVEVTSASTFVGTVVVRYRVLDATEDADRAVEGRVRITVQGRPDAPGKPTVSSVQSRQVVLSWTPPIDNGTPITGYTVTSTAGTYTKQCESTTCTLDGLTNNVEYNFVVTATNRVGTSDPSVPSETARPDVRPETPVPPTLSFGDRSLTVNWTTPATEGSPVESFTLEISPAPPSGVVQKTGLTGNSVVWEGLENGAAYKVRVRAHNRAPEPSGWSAWSAAEIPAAPPAAPGAPTTSRLEPVGSQAQLQAAWNAPAANGDAISGYQLRVMQGSTVVNTVTVPAGQTTQAVVVPASETDYTFSVRAQNKAGWGEWSPTSAPRRGFTQLAAPTSVSATEGDNRVSVSWTAGDRGGASASEVSYQYSVNNGGWRTDWVSGGNGSATIGNGQVNNNGAYTIRIRAVATVDGATYTSPASAPSNEVRPYGQIGNPKISASASGTTVSWSWSSPAKNGRAVTTEIKIGGDAWKKVAASGSGSRNVGYSTTLTVRVRTSAAGSTTTTDSASATTQAKPPPPQPRAWVSRGQGTGKVDGCNSGGCYYFVVNTNDAFSAGSYSYKCMSSVGGQFNNWEGPVHIASGRGTQLQCFFGHTGAQVWVVLNGKAYEKTTW